MLHGICFQKQAHYRANCRVKESEVCLKWKDQALKINLDCKEPLVSEKDKEGIGFSDLKGLFYIEKQLLLHLQLVNIDYNNNQYSLRS